MENLISNIERAIKHVEDSITEVLDIEKISGAAYLSPYYFQRIFHGLCGITIGEYIRFRRLTLAAEELVAGNSKVIDVALKIWVRLPRQLLASIHEIPRHLSLCGKSSGAISPKLRPTQNQSITERKQYYGIQNR